MLRRYSFLAMLILAGLLAGCAPQAVAHAAEARALENPTQIAEGPESLPHEPPASCPVTIAQDPPFVPPEPYSPTSPWSNSFWYGTNSLWTLAPTNGAWNGWTYNPDGYGQKVFWWREGYIWNEEPEPEISVTAERLDAPATPFQLSGGTNAYASDIGSAMLTGVDFSTMGCWKVTGKYRDAELSFVVWIGP